MAYLRSAHICPSVPSSLFSLAKMGYMMRSDREDDQMSIFYSNSTSQGSVNLRCAKNNKPILDLMWSRRDSYEQKRKEKEGEWEKGLSFNLPHIGGWP